MSNTEKMNPIKTENMAGGSDSSKNATPILLAPITFEDGEEIYNISTELIAIGGESQIYSAAAQRTGIKCVAKIDTSGLVYKPIDRENRRQVVSFLRSHTDYKKYHIIPLLASGTVQIQETDGMALPYPIDIFPFCIDGDLEKANKKYSYTELRKRVIPALSAALKTIHDNNLIHRDIKPANICELDGDIVVSDFGTAVMVDSGDDEAVHTELARRTLGYSAPEINSRYAKKASDYFSLGCTLAKLYNGKHPYAAVLAQESDYAFYELINEKGMEMTYDKNDEPLKHLIDALVRVKVTERIGYDEIILWLNDSKKFYEKCVAGLERTNTVGRWKEPFSFEETDYWNENDLAAAMSSKWAEGKRYLYRGQIEYFFRWDQTLNNRVDKIINETPTAKNDDLGLAYFLHYLQRGRNVNFSWCGREYKNLSDIANDIANSFERKETNQDIVKMLQGEYLSWKYRENLKLPNITPDVIKVLENDLEGILAVEQMSKNYPLLAYYYAMFQWGEKIRPNIKSADELFVEMTKTPALFYDAASSLGHDDFALASLADLGYRGQVAELKDKMGHNARENIENVYTMFETICNNKSAVRSHYYQYSPDSYLFWLKNNLSLYTYNTDDARNMKVKIEQIIFAETLPLHEIKDRFRTLKGFFSVGGDFERRFQGDFFIACLGLTKGKDLHGEITATHADAFFIDEYFGQEVPIGFTKYLSSQNSIANGKPMNPSINSHTPQMNGPASLPTSETQNNTVSTASGMFYDVIIIASGVDNSRIVEEISIIRDIGRNEAKDIVENAPSPIVQGVSNELAVIVKDRLEALGANIKLSKNSLWNKELDREMYRRIGYMKSDVLHMSSLQIIQPEATRESSLDTSRRVGRNDPCPCGSSEKYKNCCGRV